MKSFAALFTALDQTTSTSAKIAALTSYFQTAPDPDKLWTIALFTGRRPKRVITTTLLRQWAAEAAQIPLWLFEDAYPIVGDLAETIALILPPATQTSDHSLSHWIETLKTLSRADEPSRKSGILSAWAQLPMTERFLFTKLLTGGFRIGISARLMTRALAQATGQPADQLTHKLMGNWTPDSTTYQSLLADTGDTTARPYPFALAHPLDTVNDLGPASDWAAEWKWDGIRGQLILRGGTYHLWSRGEDLITDRFPELAQLCDFLPQGTVIDGEILAYKAGEPLPFSALQTRITRKIPTRKLLAETPVILMAYDLLEHAGQDIRAAPFHTRRALLALLPPAPCLKLSPLIGFTDWPGLSQTYATATAVKAEGLMLKRLSSPYSTGRKRGDWWKWKRAPLTIDAVMIYAQQGHGRRATLFSDFTFAVWNGDALVPFTKAYSGLTDAEMTRITAWVGKNTLQRFGPVRQVSPVQVFEIAFEGIGSSPRHKSGIALRFPRISRWRHDKSAAQANTLDDLRALLAIYG